MFKEITTDVLPNGITLKQPTNGFRAGSDALLLVDAFHDYFLQSYFYKNHKNCSVLDVGCGAGAISLSILKNFLTINVIGLELQQNYYELALQNAVINNLSNRFQLINGDLEKINTLLRPDSFDFIVTNPPFYNIGSGRLSFDEGKNIAHQGTINLIDWIQKSLYALKNKGFLFLICRTERLTDIYKALDNRAGNIYITPIITENNKIAKRIIIMCQKGIRGKTVISCK